MPFGPSSSAYDGSHAIRIGPPSSPSRSRAAATSPRAASSTAMPGRPASHVSPGERQLAASLGVDPAAFTWAELTRLKILRERDED